MSKIIKTTPGRTYVVEDSNGCDVINTETLAVAVTVEQGKQGYFVATAQEYEVGDAATVVQVFKLAPQQKLALLGVLGGNAGGAGELPAGWKRLEYLESSGSQYIETDIYPDISDIYTLDVQNLPTDQSFARYIFCAGYNSPRNIWAWGTFDEVSGKKDLYFAWRGSDGAYGGADVTKWKNERLSVVLANKFLTINNSSNFEVYTQSVGTIADMPITLFKRWKNAPDVVGRVFSLTRVNDTLAQKNKLVAARDKTGAPCMYDVETKKAFYNKGTGDFIYPSSSTTYALRRVLPDWGKLTEHGLRRLYHAPAEYEGELYDYALENGYKPIVEPERPEEGYWVPQWRETEEEIILDWIETEEPKDDF